jgi:Fe-S cluster biogenesis protein NfuA
MLESKTFQMAIETVRKGLKQEGGDLEVVDFKDGILYVRLTGRCKGCLMAGLTMKNWIEKTLKEAVAEIKEVREV